MCSENVLATVFRMANRHTCTWRNRETCADKKLVQLTQTCVCACKNWQIQWMFGEKKRCITVREKGIAVGDCLNYKLVVLITHKPLHTNINLASRLKGNKSSKAYTYAHRHTTHQRKAVLTQKYCLCMFSMYVVVRNTSTDIHSLIWVRPKNLIVNRRQSLSPVSQHITE